MRQARAPLAALFLTMLAMHPAALAAPGLALHYDVYYLAFRVLAVDVASRIEPEAYSTRADLRTTGLFGTMVPWQSSTTASGAIDGATLRPAAYHASNVFRERRQQIALDYGSAGAVRGTVDGALTDDARDDVPEPLRAGTIDPLTAGVAVAQRLAATGTCAGTLPVFDGLRRYDLRYDDLGTTDLEPSSRDSYRGTARHCRATVDPIAGFLRSGDHAGERATEMSAWLAPPFSGAAPVVVRMDLSGPRGTLHVHLARATPAPS